MFVQDADSDAISTALLYCFSVSGMLVSNYPNEANKTVLIDFIISNYGSFRLEEIRTAFQMNAAGRLGEVIEHFQSFSPIHFGKVMTAFRKKSEEFKRYQEGARSWNQPVIPLHRSDEIPDEIMVTNSFANFLKLGRWQLIYPGCYTTLKRYGYEFTFQDGAEHRKNFNRMKDIEKPMVNEDREVQFKKYLAGLIFTKLIQEGKTELKL